MVLDPFKRLSPEARGKELCPITLRYDDLPVLLPHELGVVNTGGVLHYVNKVIQAPELGFPELLLEETEGPVGGELSVSHLIKEISISLLRPAITRHARYCMQNSTLCVKFNLACSEFCKCMQANCQNPMKAAASDSDNSDDEEELKNLHSQARKSPRILIMAL